MNEEPTNKELLHYIMDIKNDVEKIVVQTTKTNGRVNSLEVWRGIMIGGIGVISVMVVPLLINVLTK